MILTPPGSPREGRARDVATRILARSIVRFPPHLASMRRISLLTQLLPLGALALPLAPQSTPRPAVGARVRLMTPFVPEHPQLVGLVSDVDSTAVTVHT